MTRILSILAAATMTVGAAVSVAQADAMTMMQSYTACNTTYAQCVKDGTDMTMAATPAEGAAKIQSRPTCRTRWLAAKRCAPATRL